MPGSTSARSKVSYLSASSRLVQPCQILLIMVPPFLLLPHTQCPVRSTVFPVKFSVLRSFDDRERTYAVSIQISSLEILPPHAGIPSGLPWQMHANTSPGEPPKCHRPS